VVAVADDWSNEVEWWASPAAAYVKGLQDGAQLVRDRLAEEDEALWREAVRQVVAIIDRADARRTADMPGVRPGDRMGAAA
jgi:predicted component of type VI protein secretion system